VVNLATHGYRFVRLLSVGLEASTFEVERTHHGGGIFVFRRLLPRFVRDAEARRSLCEGALLLGKLGGHGAPRLVEVGDDEHGPFVVTERLDMRSLGARLAARPPAEWMTRAVRNTFTALAYVHEAHDATGPLRIVHGDVSPDNVLVSEDAARAAFVDFSLARWREGQPRADGAFRGTLRYAAPELARCEAVDARADVFALAATLLHVASGLQPRTLAGTAALLAHAAEEPIDDYAKGAASALPADVARVLMRCVAYERGGRPQTAREAFGVSPATW
jgi:serine/threonine protein kinase